MDRLDEDLNGLWTACTNMPCVMSGKINSELDCRMIAPIESIRGDFVYYSIFDQSD
jgi:hypothetical protein